MTSEAQICISHAIFSRGEGMSIHEVRKLHQITSMRLSRVFGGQGMDGIFPYIVEICILVQCLRSGYTLPLPIEKSCTTREI